MEKIGNTNCIYHGDCKEILKKISDNFYTGILTDPPYGLSFMGKKWDYDVPDIETFKELLRVTKSGGYLFCFAGSRTQHRMAVNIEDAGWIIKDTIMWLYGCGFPKSYDIGKAIDAKILTGASNTRNLRAIEQKYGGEEYEIKVPRNGIKNEIETWSRKRYENQTELGTQFGGYGTALKPAYEPIIVAMKPNDGTYAQNALNHGVAGLNINECRIPIDPDLDDSRLGGNGSWRTDKAAKNVYAGGFEGKRVSSSNLGRWPANVIHDGSEEVVDNFPEQAKRFFYCAKASQNEKNAGIATAEARKRDQARNSEQPSQNGGSGTPYNRGSLVVRNFHPTVKPIALMEYLAKFLMMPENTKLLDPFMGSGTTLIACNRLNIDCDGIEQSKEYIELAQARLAHYSNTELKYEVGTTNSPKDKTQLNILDFIEEISNDD
jgi:site-specific DNA-methyltransferase (adenine-specific)